MPYGKWFMAHGSWLKLGARPGPGDAATAGVVEEVGERVAPSHKP